MRVKSALLFVVLAVVILVCGLVAAGRHLGTNGYAADCQTAPIAAASPSEGDTPRTVGTSVAAATMPTAVVITRLEVRTEPGGSVTLAHSLVVRLPADTPQVA